MKLKKILSGVLAGAMVITSLYVGDAATAQAAGAELVASYSFDDETLGDGVKAQTTDYVDYEGDLAFGAGKKGKAVQLGDYGIVLPQTGKEVGESYSISFWAKPTAAEMARFSPLLFVGASADNEWAGMASSWVPDGETAYSGKVVCWAGGEKSIIPGATAEKSWDMPVDEWAMLTFVYENGTISLYKNDQFIGSNADIPQLLDDNGQITFGVNHWDPPFKALVDEVKVYKGALTAEEVAADYKANAEAKPIATYDFNDGKLPEGCSLLVKGLEAYDGEAEFAAGKSGKDDDKAISLAGKYGVELKEKNLGSAYTVCAWVNPTTGKTSWANPVVALGNDKTPKWLAISGTGPENTYQLWGGIGEDHFTPVGSLTFPAQEWTMLTITQDGGNVALYKNDELVGTGKDIVDIMNNEDGATIHLGVNFWDATFDGLFDNVSIYDQALSAKEVALLFNSDLTSEEILKKDGITVTPTSLTIPSGQTRDITVTVPAAVEDEVKFTYATTDETVATAADKKITAKDKPGNATITVTATIGETSVSQEVAVKVIDAASIVEGVAADYDLTKAVDGKIIDKSGRGNDATIHGEGYSFDTVEGVGQVMTLFGGKTTTGEDGKETKLDDTYLDLPLSIMDSLTDKEVFTVETKFARSADCGVNAWLFCFGSEIKSSGTNYLFLSPNFTADGGHALRTGIKDNSNEKLFGTAEQTVEGVFNTVDMVFDHGKIYLYWNGRLLKYNSEDFMDSGYSIMNDVVNVGAPKTGVLGYIANSCWAPDGKFQGQIASFKVLDKAMTAEEAQAPFQADFAKPLDEYNILGKNESLDSVKYDLDLPISINETDVAWTSSDEKVISTDGKVTNGSADTKVTLTGTMTSGTLKAERTIEVTVKALDVTKLQEALANANDALKMLQATGGNTKSVESAITRGNTALESGSQTTVDSAVTAIERAIANVEVPELFTDPFKAIDDSKYPAKATIMPGEAKAIFEVPASIKDYVDVAYKSDDASVVTVAADGKATGVKAGKTRVTATVTAKSDGFAHEYQIEVTVDIDLTKVTAKASKTSLKVGDSAKVTVTVPSAYSVAKPAISYSAAGSVSVDKSGNVKAVGEGEGAVIVRITAGGKAHDIQLKFNVSASAKVKVGATELAKGKTTTIKVTGAKNVKYSVSGKAVTVSKTGKVTAVKAGTAKVTVKANGKKVQTITFKVGEITGKSSVKVKKSITLKVKGLSGKAKWSVSPKKSATINNKGKLTAKKKGTVTVTAKVGKVKITKKIKIK